MLPVQRFADLALSTLRLVYVAQHCGITEPERGEEKRTAHGKKKKINKATRARSAQSSLSGVVLSVLSRSHSYVNNRMNVLNVFRLTRK